VTTIGDLGCAGVDVDEWRKQNRVPLFPNKVNRWVLVRTLRDDPTPDDLKNTLAATFSKWFAGMPFDAALPSKGTTRSATADLIKLEHVSKERLSFPQNARRREELPGILPRVRSGEVVWLEVSFAYRGQLVDMPWPVRAGAAVQLQSSANCPVDADWMLDAAAVPTVDAPPEKSSSEKAGETITDTAQNVGAGIAKVVWIPLALIGVGLVLYFVGLRAASSTADTAEAA
jgi:hypothetical protein